MKPTAKILLVLLAVLTAQTALGQSRGEANSLGLYKEHFMATYEHPKLKDNLGITCEAKFSGGGETGEASMR